MIVHRELTISGPPEELADLMQSITSGLNGGWRRDESREDELAPLTGERPFVFRCEQIEGRDSASLYLFPGATEKELWVSNIVPEGDKSRLSIEEYNRIIEDFFNSFVEPNCRNRAIVTTLTAAEVGIDNWLKTETVAKLVLFSRAANRSTGSSHPADEKRWFAFIAAAHSERSELTAPTLDRWLIEEEGWGHDMAAELSAEYDTARRLLDFYDADQR